MRSAPRKEEKGKAMSLLDVNYICASCGWFEYDGENKKGHCTRIGAYYWPTDSCSLWIAR